MAFVVSVRSSSLFIPKRKLPKALASLQELARVRPRELESADAVLAAKDLSAALRANFWKLTLDDEGNAVALELSADKLPTHASETAPAPLLGALSKHADHGVVHVVSEGNPGTELRYILGGALKMRQVSRQRFRFEQQPAETRVAPGETVRVEVKLVHQWDDWIRPSLRVRDSEQDVVGEIDTSPMEPGESRLMTLRVGGDALGVAGTILDARDGERTVASSVIAVDVVPTVHEPLHVTESEPHELSKRQCLLNAASIPRALNDLRAYASSAKSSPGGAFLADVERAPDLPSALTAAGLLVSQEGAVIRSVHPRAPTLPCSEHHLYRLLVAIADRTSQLWDAGFRFVKPSSPAQVIDYRFYFGLSRKVSAR